jgi:hypothetical protein
MGLKFVKESEPILVYPPRAKRRLRKASDSVCIRAGGENEKNNIQTQRHTSPYRKPGTGRPMFLTLKHLSLFRD